jgi:thioredoxin-dependent peroxiredoxin
VSRAPEGLHAMGMLGGAYHIGQPFSSMRRSQRESPGSGRLSHTIDAVRSPPTHQSLEPPNAMQHDGAGLIGQHAALPDVSAPASRVGSGSDVLSTDAPQPATRSERIRERMSHPRSSGHATTIDAKPSSIARADGAQWHSLVRRCRCLLRSPPSKVYCRAMLKRGDAAPAFSAPTTGGPIVSLSSLRGKIVVLYFYRRAITRNCTVETKGFRDNYEELRALGAEVVGVSPDEMGTQCSFARELGVTFPLIADSDRAICRSYDVQFAFLPLVHRVTYVIDRDGVVAGVFNHEFQVLKHLDEVLRFVHEMARPPSRRKGAGA